jgi:hypothetical protein
MQREVINPAISGADLAVIAVTVFLLSLLLAMYLSFRKRGDLGE